MARLEAALSTFKPSFSCPAAGARQGSCRINQAAAFNVAAGGGLSHT
jgi:hypothetical protein